MVENGANVVAASGVPSGWESARNRSTGEYWQQCPSPRIGTGTFRGYLVLLAEPAKRAVSGSGAGDTRENGIVGVIRAAHYAGNPLGVEVSKRTLNAGNHSAVTDVTSVPAVTDGVSA